MSKGFGPGFNSTSPQSEIMHNSRTFGLLGFDLRLISILDATTASEGRTSTLADTNWSLMTVTFAGVIGVSYWGKSFDCRTDDKMIQYATITKVFIRLMLDLLGYISVIWSTVD